MTNGSEPGAWPPPAEPPAPPEPAQAADAAAQTSQLPAVRASTESQWAMDAPNAYPSLPPAAPWPTQPSSYAPGPAITDTITCPECGAVQTITLTRRDAADFCQHCDYPLFWTPSQALYDRGGTLSDESLRRLPGTVGRATVASLACPHCAEPNPVTGQLCVRCGLTLHPVAEPPPPLPVYIPPPPAPVYVEEKSRVAWWVWALMIVVFLTTVVLVVLVLTHKIGAR